MPSLLRRLWVFRHTLVLALTPLCLLPVLLLQDSKEARCAYGVMLMAVYWIAEVLPTSVTALLPIVLFPVLGVLPAHAVCDIYIKEVSLFGVGCLIFAIALESSCLHKRLALRALTLMGPQPMWLMLGFMLPTWFLSMWISNTSTTVMMLPIVTAVLKQIKDSTSKATESLSPEVRNKAQSVTTTAVNNTPETKEAPLQGTENIILEQAEDSREVNDSRNDVDDDDVDNSTSSVSSDASYRQLCKGLLLCVAYSANIGGTGSLSGTSPNLIMKGQADRLFQERGLDSGVNFVTWMLFSLPSSALCVLMAWLWMALWFFGPSFAEKVVIVHFLALFVLWLTKKPPGFKGWDTLFLPKFVGDSTVPIMIVVSLFVFPSECPQVFFWKSAKSDKPRAVRAILDWDTVQQKYPWGFLFLIGGGFAMAEACEKSGLSAWVGEQLVELNELQPWQITLFLSFIVSLATEITSNTATTTLLLPIVSQLALNLQINPLYFMFPCTLSASMAFMLPVATGPNVLVFATGYIKSVDMLLAGFVLNVLCVLVINVATNTWGMAFFRLSVLPQGFRLAGLNTTALPNATTDNSTLSTP